MSVTALERIARPTLRALALACALSITALAAACDDVPLILPPPFGPVANTPPRLFFPTGLAIAPSGQVLIANGNFDHAFAGGTIVSLDPVYLEQFFEGEPPDQTVPPAAIDIPPSAFLGVAMIGNYAGPLTIDQTQVHAFTGSRDTSELNAVVLDPSSGALSCLGIDGGTTGTTDCSSGFINTNDQFDLVGPYAIVPGVSRLPGASADVDVLFVSPLIPHIDGSISDTIYTSATLAALAETDVSQALWYGQVSNYTIANGVGGGPMVFDAQRRKLVLGGCYTRFTGQSVGDPSSGKCLSTTGQNLIRFIGVDEGSNPQVDTVDIAPQISSTDTEDLTLGNYDPTSGIAQTLYAITRTPDLLIEVALPSDPSALVQVTHSVSMPIFPSKMLRLQRPPDQPGPDLIAVTLESSQSMDVYDATAKQVVGQVENLGVAPSSIAQFPPQAGDQTARLVVTVFQECRVALIDINFARPWEVRLRGLLGSCPVAPP